MDCMSAYITVFSKNFTACLISLSSKYWLYTACSDFVWLQVSHSSGCCRRHKWMNRKRWKIQWAIWASSSSSSLLGPAWKSFLHPVNQKLYTKLNYQVHISERKNHTLITADAIAKQGAYETRGHKSTFSPLKNFLSGPLMLAPKIFQCLDNLNGSTQDRKALNDKNCLRRVRMILTIILKKAMIVSDIWQYCSVHSLWTRTERWS